MNDEILLDAADKRLLTALQADGRQSFEALAQRAQLSPSAALRRVKRLEERGVIRGYAALLAPERLGLGLTAYINVRLEKQAEHQQRSPMAAFQAAVQSWPEVVECAALTGEMDYLLRVLVADMAHYSAFIMERLLKHPAVRDCKSSFVLQQLKTTTALPL